MKFSRQEHCRGLPFPSPGDLPDPGTEPWLLHHWATWETQISAGLLATQIYVSHFRRLKSDQGPSTIWLGGRPSCGLQMAVFSLRFLMAEPTVRSSTLSVFSSPTPSWGLHPHDLIAPKDPSLSTFTSGWGCPQMNFRGIQALSSQGINRETGLSYTLEMQEV